MLVVDGADQRRIRARAEIPRRHGCEGESAPSEGSGGFGEARYRGPCPPPGHGPHRYFFRLHALDAALALAPGASREDLDAEIEGHVLESAELIGTYEQN